MIGRRIKQYEITAALGKGGMGEVWKAHDSNLGRDVAIKMLPPAVTDDSDRIARFEREARLVAQLNHAHIATVYGLEELDGSKYLVMEFVDGSTLEERVQSGSLDVEEALTIALQIALALEAAHSHGVVHRDLKPANIMLTRDGTVKVLDFGLAKAFSTDLNSASPVNSPALSVAMQQQGVLLGTAAYMSPEQASGQGVDNRSDIWAFGVVLYEMLTGLPLFAGHSIPHVLAAILKTEPDWSHLPSDLHPRIRLLLERCLEKKLRDRYHSISDVRVDIEKVLSDPRGFRQHGGPPAASWRSLHTGVAIILIALAIVSTWMLKPSVAVDAGDPIRFSFSLNPEESLRYTGRNTVAISPDGTRLAYNTTAGIYLRGIDEFDGRIVAGTELFAINPHFSPDGRWIAYWDGQLRKVSTNGGAPVPLAATGNPQGADWSPDGSTIIVGQSNNIVAIPADGGEPEVIWTEDGAIWDPAYLPDGRGSILFAVFPAGLDSGEIRIWTPGTEQSRALFDAERAIYSRTGHLIVADPAVPNALFARRFDLESFEFGGPEPIVDDVALSTNKTHYAISASGTLVYVEGRLDRTSNPGEQPAHYVAVFDRQGSRELLDLPPRSYRSPRFSPDGSQIAVEVVDANLRSSIWIYDVGGGSDLRRLTQIDEGSNSHPVWAPDGERVTFTSDRDGAPGIYWQPADGSAPADRLTAAEPDTRHYAESWSQSGVLSFAVVAEGATSEDWGIWTRDANGDIEPYFDLAGSNQRGSSFSPDGSWLVYASNEANTGIAQSHVFVERYPRTGERYEIAGIGSMWPVWSRDGSEIFYQRNVIAPGLSLQTVSIVATEPGFRFATRSDQAIQEFTADTDAREFDPLPDTTGWLMLVPRERIDSVADGISARRIKLAVNWLSTLDLP